MEPSLRLSFGKLLSAAIVLAVVVSLLTLMAFMLGQQSGMKTANGNFTNPQLAETSELETQSPVAMPALPKAMTATPASKPIEKWSINNEQATRLAQEQNPASESRGPLVVKQIEFSPSEIRITGEIDYAGYLGDLEVLGYPVIEAHVLNFRVLRLFLNGQVLPQIVSPAVESQVNSFFSQALVGYDVLNIEMGDGILSADLLPW